jgi:hypothetical protein
MGILNDYMNGTKAEPTAVPTSSSLINSYMNSGNSESSGRPRVIIDTTPSVPRSGFSKEDSDALNAQPGVKGTPNNITSFPSVGNAIAGDFNSAVNTMGEGLGDVFNKKPASGVGKIAMGALGVPGSLLTGPTKVLTSITGNPDFADKVELAASSIVPVAPVYKATKSFDKSSQALSMLVDHIGEKNLPDALRQLKADPTLAPADISTRVRQSTQRLLANVDGPHANYIENVAESRKANAAGELQKHMDDNLGQVVNPVEKLAQLKQNIKEVGDKEIAPALSNIKNDLNTQSIISYIDDKLSPDLKSIVGTKQLPFTEEAKKALSDVRDLLLDKQSTKDGTTVLTAREIDPESLSSLQSVIRGEAEGLIKNGGQDARVGNAMMGLRNHIVNTLDAASNGTYKQALSKYRDEYHIEDAFNHGHDAIMANGRKIEDRPEFFQKWVKDATPEELQAAREGARIAYDTQMFGFKHAARRGTDIGDVGFNVERMEALFGKEETNKMSKVFENAKMKADTNNKLTQGSQSRVQQSVGTEFEPYDIKKNQGNTFNRAINVGLPLAVEGGSMFLGAPTGLGAAIGAAGLIGGKIAGKTYSAVKAATIKKLEDERNMQYAKLALPSNGPSRDKLIQELDSIANKSARLSTGSKLRMLISP